MILNDIVEDFQHISSEAVITIIGQHETRRGYRIKKSDEFACTTDRQVLEIRRDVGHCEDEGRVQRRETTMRGSNQIDNGLDR